MSVRLRYKMSIMISSTQAEEKDLGNGSYEIVTDTQGEGGSWKTNLPAASVDVRVNLGNLALAMFVAIKTNTKNPNDTPVEIMIKRNTTGGEAISILPMGDSKQGHFLFSTNGLSALYASNAGAVDMELTVFGAGD